MDQQQPVVTEDQYNATMAAAYRGQGNQEADPVELPPPAAMPEGGVDKFYNKQTGEYNWAAHAREAEYRLGQYRNQTQEPDPTQQQYEDQQQNTGVQQPWERAGLNGQELAQKIMAQGDITPEDYAALEAAGYPRDFARSYIEGMVARIDGQIDEQINYVGGEQEWESLRQWAVTNLDGTEQQRIENLLRTDYRSAVDLLRFRRGTVANEPDLINGDGGFGNSFGYRSKAEMKNDMADPRYMKDPMFRQQVAQRMRQATWDLDPQ